MPQLAMQLCSQEATKTSSPSQEAPNQTIKDPEEFASAQQVGEDGQLAAGLAAAVANMALLAAEPARAHTGFHSSSAPSMTLAAYMARLHQYFGCSGGCYVLALIYLDRLTKRCPDIAISPLCCHRLLLISLMVAAKFNDDVFYSNMRYGQVGGVHLKEINRLEARFVELLGWKLQVQPEEYESYHNLCMAASRGAASMPARRV